MITIIPETPANIAAFKASGEITKSDFENCVIPQVKVHVNTYDELNYLMLLDADVKDFSFGAMMQDILLGLKNVARWNRVAIVTDNTAITNFTEIFSVVVPGEYETFPIEDLDNAIFWCANGNEKD